MTIPSSTTPEHEHWQGLYSPTESHWQDLKRIRNFVTPIIGLVFIATLYIVVGYTSIHMEDWIPDNINITTYYIYLTQILIIIFSPTILLLITLRYILSKTSELIYSIYQPSPSEKLSSLISRKLLGVPPFPPPLDTVLKYPFVVINKPALEDDHWARWFGGPAILVIHDGAGVYLERGNQFSRVVGPGELVPLLERHERIIDIVDLRPQTKSGYVEPWTKDGVHIKLELRVDVQINASQKSLEKSSKLRYPFDPLAVKAAVEYTSVKTTSDGKLKESSWLEGAWGTITGEVNSFVAGHSLDELFLAPQIENHTHLNQQKNHIPEKIEQILSRRISEKVTGNIQERLQQNGIKVLNIQITDVVVPREVQDLRTKYWRSIRGIISAQRNSRAEAERIRIREQAHADAQRTILMTITQKLENIDADNMTEPLILSLSGLLDQGLDDPLIRPWIASESFTVLEKMRKLLKERF
ncbi:MAG: hypothetical protein IPP66_19675 [Anaerolineales bacterium]|nr:hypothetical protein [Anaerolineales bacterium]